MIDLDTTADVSAITLDLGPFSVTEIMLDSIGVELIEMLADIEPPVVIIDLSPTHHLGSKAVSILVNAWRTTRARKGRLAFCRLNPYSREVLRTLHLDRHWEVYDTREDAVRAMRASAEKSRQETAKNELDEPPGGR
ncbi:MAG: STAS domain-containing protein [Pirellulales bacterium]